MKQLDFDLYLKSEKGTKILLTINKFMRPIKFRYIFDATERDLWIQVREFTIEEIEENEPYNFMDCCFTTSSKITRVQFTWLLDKNGKEIYEGDILNLRWWSVVLYRDCWFTFCYWEWNNKVYWNLFFDFKDCEVIGNIYENPELLINNK